jgi:16S rRNA (uracil1498-N3)-methyltransferase
MARRRFFVNRVHRGQAVIEGENAHHLTRVLRVEVGQKFEISDGERAWLASVEAARKDMVQFTVLEDLPPAPELPPVTLYLALIKFDHFEWAVEKATELGVARIVPVEAARTEKGLFDGSRKRIERWRRIAHEAGEQSRRLRPPEVADSIRFTAALAEPVFTEPRPQGSDSGARHGLWMDELPGAKPLFQAFSFKAGDSAAVMIGPEGGWTDGEREAFAPAGWIAASLGPSILRAETAVCAALAVLNQIWMNRL